MTSAQSSDIAEIMQRVQSWPAPMRVALARRILESLETSPAPLSNAPRGLSAEEVMSMFQPVLPPPSDEECTRVLEEELSRRYGL